MVFSKAFALAAIFATLASAAPVQNKRDLVYETVTQIDVTTIDTTITIFPGEATPTVAAAAVITTAVAVTSTEAAAAAPTTTSTVAPAPAPTTTSVATEAPATTTSVHVEAAEAAVTTAPTTTVAPTTTAPPPAPTTTSTSTTSSSSTSTTSTAPASTSTGSSGGSGTSYTGSGTYYDTATSMSSPSYCDTVNDGLTENVLALSYAIMDETLCGTTVTVEYEGKTTTGTVVDKCMGCDADSIDMSRAMFQDLTDLDAGRITVTWSL